MLSLLMRFVVEVIIRQVDGTFRNKREECKRLEWEISDLQNQLREIVKNTEEYAEIAASEGAALSWAKQLLSAAELEWDDLCFARLDEFAAIRKSLEESIEKGIAQSMLSIVILKLNASTEKVLRWSTTFNQC